MWSNILVIRGVQADRCHAPTLKSARAHINDCFHHFKTLLHKTTIRILMVHIFATWNSRYLK